ncbi:MAG: hypothetical protein WAM54_14205 [Nitrososphaeraceae archaeon]
MVTVIKYSDTIPPQEYEKKRDEVIKLLTRMNGHLLSLDFLNYHLKLDEKYLPAYVVSRMVDEGILDSGGFYHMRGNEPAMTASYRLKQ